MDPTQAPQAPTLPQYQPVTSAPAQPVQPPQQQQPQQPQHGQQPQGQQPQQGQPQNGQQGQPQNGQQGNQDPSQPHPDFAKGPAKPGENRSVNIWIKPEEWTAQQARLQSLEDYKSQQDQIMEMREAERLRLMAEKGQVEEAFKQMKAMSDRSLQEVKADRDTIRASWLSEKKTQAVNEALGGRQFIGKDAEARNRTATAIRKVLELDLEAVIGPDNAPIVRDRVTLEPAVEFLRKRLDSPDWEFNGLLAPVRPGGGSGTDGARPPAPTITGPAPQLTPDETVRAWLSHNQQPIPAFGLQPLPRRA